MYRGTTPTLIFKFKFDIESLLIDKLYITFTQNGTIVLEKGLDDIVIDKKKVFVTLSQEETLLFSANDIISIQARLKIEDKAYASTVIKTNLQGILKEGVI